MTLPVDAPSARAAVRVVVVDDSLVMRELLQSALTEIGDIVVVGTAANSHEAREVIRATNPDVVTLDVEMPGMDGLEFLRRIMTLRPMPVVMVAGSTTLGAETTLAALEIGAVDFVAKPRGRAGWKAYAAAIRNKVCEAANVRFDHRASCRLAKVPAAERQMSGASRHCDLIAIGASTGGVTAIGRLLANLPKSAPPLVIAQHMPPGFTDRFAARLARATGLDVAEAFESEVLARGAIRIAPGGQNLRVARQGRHLVCHLGRDAAGGNHRPSIDALFTSIATALGKRAIGVILTGMGSDGAKGLMTMRTAGAQTLGEAEHSCTVYGMPKAAMQLGAVAEELAIDDLAKRLLDECASSNVGPRAAPKTRR